MYIVHVSPHIHSIRCCSNVHVLFISSRNFEGLLFKSGVYILNSSIGEIICKHKGFFLLIKEFDVLTQRKISRLLTSHRSAKQSVTQHYQSDAEIEEPDPFANIEKDEDENEVVLEDC